VGQEIKHHVTFFRTDECRELTAADQENYVSRFSADMNFEE
jgi:hypothetical protein